MKKRTVRRLLTNALSNVDTGLVSVVAYIIIYHHHLCYVSIFTIKASSESVPAVRLLRTGLSEYRYAELLINI
jgi:hypothetical protein